MKYSYHAFCLINAQLFHPTSIITNNVPIFTSLVKFNFYLHVLSKIQGKQHRMFASHNGVTMRAP